MADSKETLICPACGKEMKKFILKEQNFYIDICINGCGGIWFDNREYAKFDEKSENMDEIAAIYADKTFPEINSPNKKICPVCNAVMVDTYTNVEKSVVTDTCYSCGGVFLDYKELEKIRASQNTKEEFDNHLLSDNKNIIDSTLKEPMQNWKGFEGRKESVEKTYQEYTKINNFISELNYKIQERIAQAMYKE